MMITLDQATAVAQVICQAGVAGAGNGFEIVVVVTDASGKWVGVAGSQPQGRTVEILAAALRGAEGTEPGGGA